MSEEMNLCKSLAKHHSPLILLTPLEDKEEREGGGDDHEQQREEMEYPGHEPSELGFSRPLWKKNKNGDPQINLPANL